MPTCPGCQQRVPYDQLDTHERYCSGLRDLEASGRESVQRLEKRIDALDRRFERRIRALEATAGTRSPPQDGEEGGLRLLEQDG